METDQVREAVLQEAQQEAAQAKQAERRAVAQLTALEKVGCHHCCLAVYQHMITSAAGHLAAHVGILA